MDDSTLGGYQKAHERPPAFEGADGQAYSVSVLTSDFPEGAGFGAALLFVRWSPSGTEPTGHVETDYLFFGSSKEDAERRILELPLASVKEWLDHAIEQKGADNP